MATSENTQKISLDAGADLSAAQFHFVHPDVTGRAVLAAVGGAAIGVLYNDPKEGRAAEIAIGGIQKVTCGGEVTSGGPVASDAAGKAVDATTGDEVLGTALEAGVDGRVISFVFHPRGPLPA